MFKNDPNFVTTEEHEDDDDGDVEVVPMAAPAFIGATPSPADNLDELLAASTDRTLEVEEEEVEEDESIVPEFLEVGQIHRSNTSTKGGSYDSASDDSTSFAQMSRALRGGPPSLSLKQSGDASGLDFSANNDDSSSSSISVRRLH